MSFLRDLTNDQNFLTFQGSFLQFWEEALGFQIGKIIAVNH